MFFIRLCLRPERFFLVTTWLLLITWGSLFLPEPAWAGETFHRVRAKGVLRCGVSEGIPGFSVRDAKGRWTGIDADFCRALAAAIFRDPEKVVFVPLKTSERFPTLRSGKIDILLRNTTWTMSREAGLGIRFAGVAYYDGQGFMVRKNNKIKRISDLKGATICVQKGTTHEDNLVDYFQMKKWTYRPLVVESLMQNRNNLTTGRCQAFTSDRSELAAVQSQLPGGAKDYVILSGQISKEPLSPAVKTGDNEWFTLVEWVLFALTEAEERGITQENVRSLAATRGNPGRDRFLGTTGNLGKLLGVSSDWTVMAIASGGNYGEIFERNLGRKSVLNLDRGPNRLWTKGGLMYAPPFR